MEDIDISELKTKSLHQSVKTSVDIVSVAKNTSSEKIIDCTKLSSLSHLWRVTAYVLCLVFSLKKTTQKMEVKFSLVLTDEEVKKAEDLWIENGDLWIMFIQHNLLHNLKYEQ